jgi:FKBP-type peptidyl-prolyl cis-trans isomerase FklB
MYNMKNEQAAANLKAGQEFLASNKEKAGVTELPSGLQYEVITEGTGAKPTESNKVKCHYHGTLINGTIFDSSVQRGQPASFPLNQVIKGWTEGLQLMPTGSKWRFFIPPHLGYGERQASAEIGPNSTLIFEVELLGIN